MTSSTAGAPEGDAACRSVKRLLEDAGPAAIVALDADGRILAASEAAGNACGIPAEDLAGLSFADLVDSNSRETAARQERYRLMIDGLVDYAICMLDPSGVVTEWNSGAERVTGYCADEVLGRHFSHFYPKGDRAQGLPARALAAATAGKYETEGWRLRKDGGRFWAWVVINPLRDEDGRLIGFAKITRDITERRVAQEALRESERQFRLLVGGVSDYALYMLDLNGVVISWNTGAQRIKGYLSDEIIGQHYSRFYTEADRSAGLPARALACAAKQGKYEATGWRVRKDGSLFWASVVLDAIYENGSLTGFAKITRDITERREAELELERALEQLSQSQKLEALGHLTGGVAHDFNNLLMIVTGQAQLMRRTVGDNPKALRGLDMIDAAADRGVSLTRQLLSFARRQQISRRRVEMSALLEGLSQLLVNSIGDRIQLQMSLPQELWAVEVDPSELELALVNLAVNARDAMPEGGVLSIVAENLDLEPAERDIRLAGQFVALTIADTGVGIPEDVLPKVFDPFFTTKQAGKGTGLGLSQVYGFARQAGGLATVDSKVGAGTRITLYLPRSTGAVEDSGEAAQAGLARGGGSILLAEDNPDVANVSAGLLRQLGYSVTVVSSAEAALEKIDEGATFDLVFSDIVMAGTLDGLGLARELKSRAPNLPVLLATGYADALESVEDEFAILRKPFRIAELSRAVAKTLGEARQASSPANIVSLGEVRRLRSGAAED